MNAEITNKQIRDTLVNINNFLGGISVSGNDVFTLADCRNALKQITTIMPVESDDQTAAKEIKNTKSN